MSSSDWFEIRDLYVLFHEQIYDVRALHEALENKKQLGACSISSILQENNKYQHHAIDIKPTDEENALADQNKVSL